MKFISLILAAITAQAGLAQTCEPSSKEMAQYYAQKNWTSYTHSDASGASLSGYVDRDNRFYFGSLSRKGVYPAELKVDASNPGYKEFFKFCREPERYEGALFFMRRKRQNKYSVRVRYLPELSAFKNNPLEDLRYRETDAQLYLSFDPKSIVLTQGFEKETAKRQIYRMLDDQIRAQKEFGVLTLDLSGWDDFACDLLQGRAQLTVGKSAASNSPLVRQEQVVDPNDLKVLYTALKDGAGQAQTKEMALYSAARTQARLELDRRIASQSERNGFEILKSLMDPGLTKVADLNGADLSCAGDRLQKYTRPVEVHTFSIQFGFQPLEKE